MDKQTIITYNKEAKSITQLHKSLIPERIYELISEFFIPNAETADIGCGIGRDTEWLAQQGYLVLGVDASKGMLKQARILHQDLKFIEDSLPELLELNEKTFANILCSAVLMHLNQVDRMIAYQRFITLLEPNGSLIISFRSTNNTNQRENGKLYDLILYKELQDFFSVNGLSILHHEFEIEQKRNLIWHNVVIRNLS